MKSIEEINAENDEIVARADSARKAAIRRLKQRIARFIYDPLKPASLVRRDINTAIEEWAERETKKGTLR